MKTIITLIITTIFTMNLHSQEMSFLKDSTMSIYMENGYANKHFMPDGKTDKNDLRQGKWKDYEVVFDKTFVTENNEPTPIYGYFLLYGEGDYSDGKRVGDWKFYVIEHETFKKYLQQEVTYSEGIKEGDFKYRLPNGKLAIKGQYVGDAIEGDVKWYYDNGMEYGNVFYKQDSREGKSTFFYQSGKIYAETYFLNDEISGTSTYYYENGNTKEIANYASNQLQGTYKYFYENRQLWIEKEYKNGLLMNVKGSFDNMGNPRDHGTIKDGNGTVKYYTEEGIVYSIQTVENGEIVKEEPQSVPDPFKDK